ncbi:MAG TPA: LecA/PA-IL family lectin [Anaerolineales bacterium]|nr:LecA/PA-IL family lectin [Anaerolineales bacterium]
MKSNIFYAVILAIIEILVLTHCTTATPASDSTDFPHTLPAPISASNTAPSPMLAARTLLSVTPTSAITASPMSAGTVRVEISAHEEWQAAGMIVKPGQSITIQVSGGWKHSESEAAYGTGGIEGMDTNSVLPSAPVGSLIGRIGRGQPFEIGTRTVLTADRAGPLQLSMNDSIGMFEDNQGSLVVQLSLNTCGAGWSRLSTGTYAVVTDEQAEPNRVRAEPDTSAELLTQIYPGSIVRVLEGPICANGFVFWKVESKLISGGMGWTAEGDGSAYYLEPYPPQLLDTSPMRLVIVGGTYFDSGAGLMGTGFAFRATLTDGQTIDHIDIQGPPGWNSNEVYQLYPYQPPRMAQDRAIGWVFIKPVAGEYTATAEISSGQPVSTTFAIDIASQLPAPVILSVEGSPSQVKVEWSGAAEMHSFLVRLEQEPFTSVIMETLVSGEQRSLTFSGLSLKSGVEHRVVIFAFSNDLYTPGAMTSPANLSAYVSETFTP